MAWLAAAGHEVVPLTAGAATVSVTLPGGALVVAVEGLELAELRLSLSGPSRWPVFSGSGRLIFDGNRDHWQTCARLPGPLMRSAEGFQYMDFGRGGELGAVVTIHLDGSF